MGYMCDFCGEQRSMVYCRSDAASLCLSCDRNVHSANALSKRHSRTLLCERCNTQPAFVRYVEERISLCQNCDWMNHGTETSTSVSPSHKRHAINCYSGCPSAAELSSIWSFITDTPNVRNSGCEQELGLMTINENNVVPSDIRRDDEGNDKLDDSSNWPLNVAQSDGSSNNTLPRLGGPRTKCPGVDSGMYEDFDMDEVDLTFENYEELFGVSLNQSEEFCENGGMDSLFGPKDTNFQALIAEGLTAGLGNPQPACSNGASADSMMSSKTEPIICYSSRQAHSNLSFSGNGESSANDHQDCGASAMLLMGEPPWCPPCAESSFTPTTRSNAVLRYKEKKKTRKFEKSIRYVSRKARADVRKRVKGRFIKAGDVYDYDPLSDTRSF